MNDWINAHAWGSPDALGNSYCNDCGVRYDTDDACKACPGPRLTQPEPAACEEGKQPCYAHTCSNCGREWESKPPEPLARDMTKREHMRLELTKAVVAGLLANRVAAEYFNPEDIMRQVPRMLDALLAALEVKDGR